MPQPLDRLTVGMPIVVGGDRVVHVDEELAAAFTAGDALLSIDDTGDLLHVPADARKVATDAVSAAVDAFATLGRCTDDQITAFFHGFADRLADDDVFAPVSAANTADVEAAAARGRSTTRLVLDDRMRTDMVAGLRGWAGSSSGRGDVVDRVAHDGWSVDLVRDGLGVVAFVFEGRPNVVADACGVIRSGNTVVFRIGSDALGTARAILEHALTPALVDAGLPPGAATLVATPSRAAGWAMFADPRLALAVARGSGPAVAQLGAVARQAGNAVSLHGTGGAWIVADATADTDRLRAVVRHSLDRKVCNTVNTVAVVRERADELVDAVLGGLDDAASAAGVGGRVHVAERSVAHVPSTRFDAEVEVHRADGVHREPQATPIADDRLGHEWEWEASPEITLVVVDDVAEAVALFNAQAPRFVASLVSEDTAAHDAFFDAIDAPFVGDGFTRWVDGQYALSAPELGLSNWETGRLFARPGVLSGSHIHTVRLRAHTPDQEQHR